MIYLTSDWHFLHLKPFIYEARGFSSAWEHDEEIIRRHNEIVTNDDIVYCLGDCMLGQDLSYGLSCMRRLKGQKYIIRGNHDTDRRWAAYGEVYNVYPVGWSDVIKHDFGQSYLCHYPTETSSLEHAKPLKKQLVSFHGHTHSSNVFEKGNPYQYNVSLDAHNCYPVSIEEAYQDIAARLN